ncbi:MAG: hypothetical protein Q9168_006705 [Polycauliona sp. 1 TL-2023]
MLPSVPVVGYVIRDHQPLHWWYPPFSPPQTLPNIKLLAARPSFCKVLSLNLPAYTVSRLHLGREWDSHDQHILQTPVGGPKRPTQQSSCLVRYTSLHRQPDERPPQQDQWARGRIVVLANLSILKPGFRPMAKPAPKYSAGSEVNGFRSLQIGNASSPYAATNQSTASIPSIQANLQRERGIAHGPNGVRNSRASGNGSMHHQPMSPLNGHIERNHGESQRDYLNRSAPIIAANPVREVYNADKPTAGQPYAFPDPDVVHSSGSNENLRQSQTPGLSRRNSGHGSLNSSLYTTDSRHPGSHRNADGEELVPGTHHHSLQHKAVSSIAGESDSPDATSPYSRTPALRASHKMAERKRRTEMKHLFDSLRNQIPASHGSKSSKWEILSKASEYIKSLETNCAVNQAAQAQLGQLVNDLDTTRRENESLRAENHRLFQEMNAYRSMPAAPSQQHYAGPPSSISADPSRSLPPLINGVHASSMQGVQYTDGVR